MRIRTVPSALLLAVGLLAGCSATDGGPEPAGPSDAPVGDAPSGDAPAADPVATAVVHLVRSGPAAFFVEPVPAAVPLGAPSGDDAVSRIARAVAALLAVVDPADPDLATSVPPGTLARDVILDGDVAVLDLGGALAGSSGGSAEEVTLAQQLAHTVVAAAPEVAGVRVLLEGRPIESLWGHLDWSVPLVADPFALSPVTIEVPAFGATVPVGEVTLTGRATVFEGTVLVRLERADGTVLEEGFVTATEGGPGRGTWTWTVTLPEPGEYRLVAGASDPSDGEGPPPFEVARTVTAG
ncbi:MAG: Gmad2 immunoglobulin-like domain-containing protein [Nitriliruptoraceae bacterium]